MRGGPVVVYSNRTKEQTQVEIKVNPRSNLRAAAL